MELSFDYVLVGGGLQNCLLALALAEKQPHCSVALVEREDRLGGNHTWCFHSADLEGASGFVEPLVVKRWPGYSVHFPTSERHLDEPYSAVTSDRVHDVVSELAAASNNLRLFLSETATFIEAQSVVLRSGTILRAKVVVEARGPTAFRTDQIAGYQKFLGLELEVASAPERPILMDARVPQTDGFRFVYVLPLARARVLVEDTYFSDSPDLDRATLRAEIFRYAAQMKLSVTGVVREESGVLPLPRNMLVPKDQEPEGCIRGGYQGGWFHPTTGYSFPLAARLSSVISSIAPSELAPALGRLTRERFRQQRFCTLLNRLLFDGFEPSQRFNVFERFYRLPPSTVRRFYALTLTRTDRARILCGRPPEGFRSARLFNRLPKAVAKSRTLGVDTWSKL